MTPSDLKYHVEAEGHCPHFFTRKTMKFFGDTMRNYGVRASNVRSMYGTDGQYVSGGVNIPVLELYRKRPVNGGLRTSAYFCAATFKRIHPITETHEGTN